MRGEAQGSVLRSLETLFGAGSATGMTDRELLDRFLARRDEGAEAAFAALVARHGPLVWSVCRNISSEAHAAEDAFQATFLILVRKASSIRRRETLGPWLYGVARRVAVRAKVTSRRQRQHEERGAEMKATSQPVLTPQEELEALHEEIGRLPERYRAAVVLCHLEGCTHAEAARVLKCPKGTVNVRVSRARELLRDRLARRGVAFSTALAGAVLVGEAATAAMPIGLAETTIKAAMQVAAGKSVTAGAVSAAVSQLTQGVLTTMTLSKVTVAAALVLTAGSVSSGIAFVAMGPAAANRAQDPNAQQEESRPKAGKKERDRSNKNLRMIALAMHNFASRTDDTRFPPPAIRKDGKPLLSWRVAILPYIDQQGQCSTTSSISTSPGTARTTGRCSTRCPTSMPRSCVLTSREVRLITKYLPVLVLCSRMSSGLSFRISATEHPTHSWSRRQAVRFHGQNPRILSTTWTNRCRSSAVNSSTGFMSPLPMARSYLLPVRTTLTLSVGSSRAAAVKS